MAIVKMKRLTLAVMRSKKQELLEKLIQRGCVEFSEIGSEISGSEIEELVKTESSGLTGFKAEYQSVVNALHILSAAVPEKTPLLSAKPVIEGAALIDGTGLEEAVALAREIEKADDRIKKISAEESRERSVMESLEPWLEFDQDLRCEGTGYAALLLGTVPATTAPAALKSALQQISDECELYEISRDKSNVYLALVALREALPELQDALRSAGFVPSSVAGMEGTAKECKAGCEKSLEELAEEKQACLDSLTAKAGSRDALKLAQDRLSARISMAEAEEKLYGTESAVLMQGWMPADREEELAAVFDEFDCAWETREPEEEEYPDVPVSLRNNRLTDGLNMVTNMYSLPAYGTVDPNPLMAPFFILFFGLMMADIGYGILMIIAAVIALKKIQPEGNTLSTCRLLLWGGIATLICGVITGGFFSDCPKQIYDIICKSKGIEPVWQGLPKLFSPTEDSIVVLIGSLILGVLHLNTGMAVSFVQKWKSGNKAGAIWEEGSLWVLLVAGIIFALYKTGIVPGIPGPVAIALLIAAVAMLLFGAGREVKGFGKVTSAFACIYNTATGWFGDVLSYSRIMALMLAGGVVGQVFNTVATMPMQNGVSVVSVLAFVIIFLLGHAMNFGLNLLGCYVHDLRLQCLEFFGKFYEDGGKRFTPLKFGGKYMRAKEN